jgi:hypothetical protein
MASPDAASNICKALRRGPSFIANDVANCSFAEIAAQDCTAGSNIYGSPRQRMRFDFGSEGLKCVLTTWRAYGARAWRMLLATSEDAVRLKKRGFDVLVDDVAGISRLGLTDVARHVGACNLTRDARVQNVCR